MADGKNGLDAPQKPRMDSVFDNRFT